MSRNKSLAVPMKATKTKAKKPLVLQDLNDDCLMEIMSHISLTDICNLVILNRRFLAIAPLKAVAKKCHSIMGRNIRNIEYRYRDCEQEDFFKALANECDSLELVGFQGFWPNTLYWLQNLKELSLKEISLSVRDLKDMPRKLKSLTLNNCEFEESYDSETWWFEFLSPTLNQLTIKSTTLKGLDYFKNLTHFHIEGRFEKQKIKVLERSYGYYNSDHGQDSDGPDSDDEYDYTEEEKMIVNLLKNNRNSLKSLNILWCHGNIRKFGRDFQFKNLETLSVDLNMFDLEEEVDSPFRISCQKLVNLTIRCYDPNGHLGDFDEDDQGNPVNYFLRYLNCGRTLKTLTIHFDWRMCVNLSAFKNLRHLELRGRGTCIPNLRHQTKLETLVMCEVDVKKFSHFSEMELPLQSLQTLTLREIGASHCLNEDFESQNFRNWLESEVPAECKWEFSYRE